MEHLDLITFILLGITIGQMSYILHLQRRLKEIQEAAQDVYKSAKEFEAMNLELKTLLDESSAINMEMLRLLKATKSTSQA
jgi:predicted  nucleic acid-binding Zn-ribbon protein